MSNSDRQGYLPFLDGFRGIAVFIVFLFHCLGPALGQSRLPWNGLLRDFDAPWYFLLFYPLTYGSAGVSVFFVISGFCIYLSYERSKESGWGHFFVKRFFRVYPPYLFALLLFFFVWPFGSFSIDSFSRWLQLGTHVLAIHNFDNRTFFGINPSFWSIAIEIQLYLIFPLLIWLLNKFAWKNTMLLVAVIEITLRSASSITISLYDFRLPKLIEFSPFSFWLSWSIGAYIAECYLEKKESYVTTFGFCIPMLVAFACPLFKPTKPFKFLAFSLLTAVAIEYFLSGHWHIPKTKFLAWVWSHMSHLGIFSYSFYLLHQPMLKMVVPALQKFLPEFYLHPLAKIGFCFVSYVPIFFVSLLAYRFIEQPSIVLGRLFWTKWGNRSKIEKYA